MPRQSGFRRIGEHQVSESSLDAPDRSPLDRAVKQYIAVQFEFLYDICHRWQIPIPPSEEQLTRGKVGWITRRGISQIMKQIPDLEKADALKLYLAEHPRSRANIPTPETAKTTGQKAWVSRLQNIIAAAQASGETMTWVEAHKAALAGLRGAPSRRTG